MKLVSDQDTSAAAQSYVSHYCPSAKLHRGHAQDICVPLQHNAAVKEKFAFFMWLFRGKMQDKHYELCSLSCILFIGLSHLVHAAKFCSFIPILPYSISCSITVSSSKDIGSQNNTFSLTRH